MASRSSHFRKVGLAGFTRKIFFIAVTKSLYRWGRRPYAPNPIIALLIKISLINSLPFYKFCFSVRQAQWHEAKTEYMRRNVFVLRLEK